MNLTIHRGTNEIGGSCIELCSENTRILIDFGMPLVDKAGKEFSFKPFENMSTDELIENSILPDIPGLYKPETKKVDGVIISHAHADHYGLLNYIGSHVKVFMGEATKDLIDLSGIFTKHKIKFHNVELFKSTSEFKVGDIKITPILVDHSACDAYMLLIESAGKRIIYSGDFRLHGRKYYMMKELLKNPPKNIDYLIMEGTQVGRGKIQSKTEDDIENELLPRFKEGKINLVFTSGQNLDRLVSIFRACLRAKKILVVDVYIALILKTMSKYAEFPYPSQSYNMKVLYSKSSTDRIAKIDNKRILYEFKNFKIKRDEINNNPTNYVMIVRPSMLYDLKKIPNLKNGNFIYSMWEGYKDKKKTKEFMDYLTNLGFTNNDIHTSGHAEETSLIEFATSIQPKNIIPIHTFSKSQYQTIFKQNVLLLDDKQTINL